MMIVLIVCIATMMVTDAAAMFTQLAKPVRRLSPTGRSFSTAVKSSPELIPLSSRMAVNDAERALNKFQDYKENLTASARRLDRDRSKSIESMNELPWYKRYLPNFAHMRAEKYQSAVVSDAKAALVESTASDLSKIETEFTQALDKIKKELAKKDKYIAKLEDRERKRYVESVPLGMWEHREPYKGSSYEKEWLSTIKE